MLATTLRALGVLLLVGLSACGDDARPSEEYAFVLPEPLVEAWFPEKAEVIEGWVRADGGPDTEKIRAHAWRLWAAVTKPSVKASAIPVWDTWSPVEWIYAQEGYKATGATKSWTRNAPLRQLQPLVILERTQLEEGEGVPVPSEGSYGVAAPFIGNSHVSREDSDLMMSPVPALAQVKYSPEAEAFVRAKGENRPYTRASNLAKINDAFDEAKTPLGQRRIEDFPRRSQTVKVMYLFAKRDAITLMPVYLGNTTSTGTLDLHTWTDFVAIDADGEVAGGPVTGTVKRGKWERPDGEMIAAFKEAVDVKFEAERVGLDRFYWFALDENNAPKASWNTVAMQGPPSVLVLGDDGVATRVPITVGDYAIVMGVHLTSREIDNWTWQTYWWHPDAASQQLAKDMPDSVEGIWRHFLMDAVYSMVVPAGDPNGEPVSASNPYDEWSLPAFGNVQGNESNCMSCHAGAVHTFPVLTYLPEMFKMRGYVNGNEPRLFAGNTKTDLQWSVGMRANDPAEDDDDADQDDSEDDN